MTLSRIKGIAVFVLLVAVPSSFAIYRQQVVESAIVRSARTLLPRTVVPTHYNLKLEPHFNEGYFNGSVEIDVACQESTNTIVLHCHKKLNVDNGEITVRSNARGENLPIVSISRNESKDALIIVLQEELHHGGTYKLHFAFKSNFSETGFFRGEDETSSGDERWYGVTIMFPTYARELFPCFDDPSFKSTFQISVAHSNHLSALSTMPLNHTEPAEKEGWVWDTFAVSPPISTYAVSVVVSQLDSGTPINIPNKDGNLKLQFHHKGNHTWRPQTNLTTYTQQLIENVINYFDVAYPFSKIDFVYLPGSLEHDNAVGLLVGSDRYSDGGQHAIQGFILHYFTQVSTPEGWTDFRILNLLSSYLYDTTWVKMRDVLFYHKLFTLRRFDNRYQRISDTPTYSMLAGEWLFYMLNQSLTEDTLRHGLARVIVPSNSRTYTVDSIWTALTEQGKEDGTLFGLVNVSTIVKSWLKKKCLCFPVMTVTRNYDDNGASLEQRIFFREINHKTTQEEEETVWWLPYEYITPQQLDPTSHVVVWFGEKHLNVTNLPDSDSFIIVNPMGSGYFLVNYDNHNWELISQYVLTQSSQLAPETRVKLLNDAFHLAFGGQLNYSVPFTLTLSLRNETNPLMWHTLLTAIQLVRTRCFWSPIEDKINLYMKNLMSGIYESRTIADDVSLRNVSYFEKTTNAEMRLIQDEMCYMGYQPCVNKLNEKLTEKMPTYQIYDNITHLNITCPALISSPSDDWTEKFHKLLSFLSTKPYVEKRVYVKNWGKCPGYVYIVERILNDIFDDNFNFTSRDWSRIVELVNNPVSHNISLNFFLQNLDRMNETSSAFANKWPSILNNLFSKMTTYNSLEKLLEIQEHYGNRLSSDSLKQLNKSLREARNAAAWYSKSSLDIYNWIENHLNIAN